MKFFYIDPQSYNNLSVYDHSLLKGMNGCEIHYFCNHKYDFKPLANAVQHPVFSYSDYAKSWRKLLSYSRSLCAIARCAFRERPQIVHIQWIRVWLIDCLFVFFMHLLGAKVIFTAHNMLPHERHWGDRRLFSWYYKVVDAIIVHTQRTRREMIEDLHIVADKVHVFNHGILDNAVDEVAVGHRVDELRTQLAIDDDTVVFGCLGMQNKYKGIHLITKVWSQSEELRGRKCFLLIVGKNLESIDYSDVKSLPNVYLLDAKVNNLDFEAYLRITSVVLLPYTRISQSGLLFSAIQAGVPVLVSDVGGLTDPLSVADVGWCIGQPTVEALAEKMEFLATHPDEVTRVRANEDAFRSVRRAYDWAEISAETQKLYHSLVTSKL